MSLENVLTVSQGGTSTTLIGCLPERLSVGQMLTELAIKTMSSTIMSLNKGFIAEPCYYIEHLNKYSLLQDAIETTIAGLSSMRLYPSYNNTDHNFSTFPTVTYALRKRSDENDA